MNWKEEAIDKLKQYGAKRQALETLPMQIAEADSSLTSIKSVRPDTTPVRSSKGRGMEDMLLDCIVLKEELQHNLDSTQQWVALVDKGLSVLDPDERKVVDRLYVIGGQGAASELAEEYFVDARTIQRWRNTALRKFTLALYGCVES